ncbi:MAG: 1,2-phenylacetyl-CoA epoxidase subunit PaaD [Saprospiraceae bacterium]|nr:1,2-phenylacetyl-CoA epoxidase subunit PaaD [Saprospiraceae bacterium]
MVNAIGTKQEVMDILETVKDPEIPVVSVVELGMIRDVRIANGVVEVDVAPTYSGCPALDVIPILIREALEKAGHHPVEVRNVISPPWTTDWITEAGHRKLKAFGIAPPVERTTDASFLSQEDKVVPCPFCNSEHTRMVSRFGSTPCKAAYQCNACLEPFDYFKCH